MKAKRNPARGGLILAWVAGAAIVAIMWPAGRACAQVQQAVAETASTPAATAATDSGIVQTGCSTCGNGGGGAWKPLQNLYEDGYAPGGCCPSCCYAGRRPCNGGGCGSCGDGGDCGDSVPGKIWGGLCGCICCPDPCYEPHWVPAANASFFVDSARPITHMRIRYDAGFGFTNPDRAEWFMPRVNPMGVGAQPFGAGKGINGIAQSVNYQDLSLYNEAALGAFGLFTEFFYRQLDPRPGPANPPGDPLGTTSGFGDMIIGTKSMLIDCELLQFTFQFKTFIPIGNFTQGLGTGHVSLEPGFLCAVKLTRDLYYQGSMLYWIPIGGDSLYQGNVFHNHASLNYVLARLSCHSQLIATAELNEWCVMNGAYTSPNFLVGGTVAPQEAKTSMVSAGPGIRYVFCNKLDVGIGSAFALTGDKWADQLIRTELRWRF